MSFVGLLIQGISGKYKNLSLVLIFTIPVHDPVHALSRDLLSLYMREARKYEISNFDSKCKVLLYNFKTSNFLFKINNKLYTRLVSCVR